MPEAMIAGSHYESDGQGDGSKSLINFYAETNSQDPARPVRLATSPGSRLIDNASTLTTSVRGLFQADGFAGGKLVIPDGTTIRLYDTSGDSFSALTGTLAGSDRVQAVFSEAQAGFLGNGALYQSTGSAVAALSDGDWATLLSDHSQSGFTSIATMGQRLIASYGSRFAFSTTLQFNTTTTLSWFTAESSPDGIVAVKAIGSVLYVCGTQTIEPWVQTGDNDAPFRPLTGQVIARGVACRDSLVELDNSLFFIADDRTVRRLDGLVPTILNAKDAWVSRALEAIDADDIICSKMETDAHSFYIINTPTFCIVYDIATQTFHKRNTKDETTWEWAFHVRKDATHYAGSRLAAKLVQLSRAYFSDDMADASTFGTEIVREFTAHLPVKMGRRPISSVRVEGTKGVGLASGQGQNPVATMYQSNDKGLTYGSPRTASLGDIGEYTARTVFHRCGRGAPEQTVFKFTQSDPVNFIPTNIRINEI